MRLCCDGCGKSVSTEVPNMTIVRAALFCPECIEKMVKDGRLHETRKKKEAEDAEKKKR
jgi:hypothetical protein